MKTKELVQYRADLFRNAATFKKVDRVPHLSFAVTWKILDGGYTLNEGLRDYDIMTKVIREHQEKYNFDAIFELGVRNIVRLVDHLGGGTYIITDEAIEYKDNALVELDELDEYITALANADIKTLSTKSLIKALLKVSPRKLLKLRKLL